MSNLYSVDDLCAMITDKYVITDQNVPRLYLSLIADCYTIRYIICMIIETLLP